MHGKDASITNDKSFSGTRSYEEAVKLLQTGYTDAAKMLKENITQKDKIQSKHANMTEHPTPHTAVVGYIPNVPCALMNLPKAMISVDRKPMKRKTLSVMYVVTGSCEKSTEYFSDAGAALLSAINLIEKSGIQTKIDLGFFAGKRSNELAYGTVCIKNYGERYSFQKVSFPLVHPSMFRRIGFKWLETVPDLKETDFRYGYGTPPGHDTLVEQIHLEQNQYLLDTEWIHYHDNSVEEVLKYLEVV